MPPTDPCRPVFIRRFAVATLLALLGSAGLGASAAPPLDHPEGLMHRLELGMEALEALGRMEEHRMLEAVLRDLRHERERDRPRETSRVRRLQRQMETLEFARAVLREAERGEAAEMVQHALEARAAVLEGDRDGIDPESPSARQIRELLALSVRLYREFGAEDRAAHLRELALAAWPERERQRQRDRAGDRRRDADHVQAREELEVLRLALPVLAEFERPGAAEIVERAVRAREVDLEAMNGPEADAVRRQTPRRAEVAEALGLASRLWAEIGHERKAQMTGRLAEAMSASARDRPTDRAGDRDRYERLLHRLEEIEQAMQELRTELRRLGRDRGR
ncbi:MAG: hypothetical protein HKO59_11275 [Phycisphaerales bacterium]|nr:hypothetical protein [Phycisphaerae bacterium]NNF44553.1 hypothetical protein [Phycisphaerales bacterium]NNM26543.1 hypothetical protein [Phycisphaerales bacterium]